jgi:TRAP-type mannitol/chloroaromatic compound transport system permease large subunit
VLVSTSDVVMVALPYVAIMLFMAIMLILFPSTALYLSELLS